MVENVTLTLPEDLARQARTVAASTRQSMEEVLLGWLRCGGAEPILEHLPDPELLALCDAQPSPAQDEELADLLERNQEGALSAEERTRLEELMRAYRTGLTRKALALKVAVARGLRPRLS